MCLATAKNKKRCRAGSNKALARDPDPALERSKDSTPQEVRRNGPIFQLRTLRISGS